MAKKNAAAVQLGKLRMKGLSKDEIQALGRKGGKSGGKARAKSLTKPERSAIAKKAATKRWADVRKKKGGGK